MTPRKILMQTTKWSNSPRALHFQNGGKSLWRPFSRQNSNAYNSYIVGKKILLGLILS